MFGAIIGDMVGSPYEFDQGEKTKEFPFFSEDSCFTDDSVMTIAVADALLTVRQEATMSEIEKAVTEKMRMWGKRYPYAGYGANFIRWLDAKIPHPYGSYGNGSAMRVSSVGWRYASLEKTKEVAKATAAVSHNHPEGIKGAQATATAIYQLRNGMDKGHLKQYIETEYGYDLHRTLDEIRPAYHHVESCMETVPQAILSFLESTSYEDAIRNAVSLGGDTDTLGAITGGIAEAYYDVPNVFKAECCKRLEVDLLEQVLRFEERRG